MQKYGKRLEQFIELIGKSQTEVANDLGMSRQQLNHITKDKGNFKIDQLTKLCKLYSINLNWLLLGVGSVFAINNDLKEAIDIDTVKNFYLIGSRIKEIQTENKLLDGQMAKKLHLPEDEYMKLCKNKVLPTIKTLMRIKENFKNIDMNWLLFDYKVKTPTAAINLNALSSEDFQTLLEIIKTHPKGG